MGILPKRELMKRMERFFADSNRGISKEMFSEICGMSVNALNETFVYKARPISDQMQIWVSKALLEWEAGKVLVKRRSNGTKFLEYQRNPQPQMRAHTGLKFTSEGFKLDIGLRNRADYSGPTLTEQMKVR